MSVIHQKRAYINIVMLLRVVGWLLLVEAGFMLIPLVTSLIYKEASYSSFMIGMAITVAAGLCMMGLRPKSRDMGKREAILLTAMVWVVFSLFGMIPFLIGPLNMSLTNSFFETMSGFTTTGLSILPSLDGVPKGFIIWRCVMQWIGGMGIILFTLAILPMLNYQGGMQLFNAEVSGINRNKLRPRVSSTAKSLWGVYFCLTGLIVLLLSLSEMSLFDAICYGLSTMSTGGFATSDAGMAAWDSTYIKIVFGIFMFIGGVNFGLLYQTVTGKFQAIKVNTAFKWYLIFIVVASAVMSLSLYINGVGNSLSDLTIDPIFQSISIMSSTGLTEPDFAVWGSPALSLLVLMMLVGACAGSTCGGAKIDRIVICCKNIKNEFYRMMHPNAVLTVRMNGKGTSPMMVEKAIMFLIIYVMVLGVAGTLLVCLGIPMEDAYFSALESISNTGLSVNLEGIPTEYNAFPVAAKWILALTMLIGRLELYTVLLLFTRTYWKK